MRRIENPSIWVTKDGEEINISDLADGHLQNIIDMLWRRAAKYLETYNDIDSTQKCFKLHSLHLNLVNEAQSRGLPLRAVIYDAFKDIWC